MSKNSVNHGQDSDWIGHEEVYTMASSSIVVGINHVNHAVKQRTPGALIFGLASDWLAAHPLIGPGIGMRRQHMAFAGQNYQHSIAALDTGLGGLAQGQVVLQPLSDLYTET